MLQKVILFQTALNIFVVVLEDKIGRHSHTVGINSGLNVIYNCMDTYELKLNEQTLSKYCGHNCEFIIFCVAAELRDNKIHAKN